MKQEFACYTTHDASLEVELLFLDLGPSEGWRAYILSDINYKRYDPHRSTACYDTHCLYDTSQSSPDPDRDLCYICWTAPIRDLNQAKTLAAFWCEITARYIRSGGAFSDIQEQLLRRPNSTERQELSCFIP
ncbi:MAG: hypothetical protein IJX71_02865 [Oscillospiraceae bacterium]|nr:hypothetical protein [Oscillospiraceae bacterium]